jgi:hypothetical protein
MMSKKCFIAGATLAACFFGLCTALLGQGPKDPNEEVKLLQAEIKRLENIIKTQQNTINQLNQKLNEQTEENERLKTLCSQAGIDISSSKNTISPKVESENLSKVSLNQLYQFYNEPTTDLQKEEQYKNNYKGKWVQWTGRVISIRSEKREEDGAEHFFVEFAHAHPNRDNPRDKVMMNITVEFDEILKQRLLSLKKGAVVIYQGKLPDSYSDLGDMNDRGREDLSGVWVSGHLSLTDGRIVSP